MRRVFIFATFGFLILGNFKIKSAPIKVEQDSKVINLDEAFKKNKKINLSDIADSVTFLPLETNKNILVQKPNFYFSTNYIYYQSNYFDWTGRFIGKIGIIGNGTYEEPEGIYNILYKDNHFYSKATKFIEYDINGMPTGKVKNIYTDKEYDNVRGLKEFFITGENFAVYSYPSTIYFFDKDFKISASRKVVNEYSSFPFINSIVNATYISYYNESVLFYNFVNDTIFSVTEKELEPRWIVRFNNELRLSNDCILRYPELMNKVIGLIEGKQSSVSIENAELIKLTDNKHMVWAVYETNQYVFFIMSEMTFLSEFRKKKTPTGYVVYFDKKTRETIRVDGRGFIDDMTGMEFFFPKLGGYDEKLMASIWPYELIEYIEKCKKEGRKINPRLLELSRTIKEDDNPILIFVHLKKEK